MQSKVAGWTAHPTCLVGTGGQVLPFPPVVFGHILLPLLLTFSVSTLPLTPLMCQPSGRALGPSITFFLYYFFHIFPLLSSYDCHNKLSQAW